MRFKGISVKEEHLLAALIVAVSTVSFLLGRMSMGERNAPPAEAISAAANVAVKDAVVEEAPDVFEGEPIAGGYVASKSGTKYHLPWCGGAKQIKEENKIWFATKEEAEAAGYLPAANCKGM